MTRSLNIIALAVAYLAIVALFVGAAAGQTTQPIPNGADLSALRLLPNTTYLVAKGGSVTASKQLLLLVDGVTIDGNGGNLTTEVAGTLFNVLRAKRFTIQNFGVKDATGKWTGGIAGHPETVVLTIASDGCAVKNCRSTDGLLKFACTTTGGVNFNCLNNDIGVCGSVPVFICTDNSTVAGNYFHGSWGEYCLRYVANSDNHGNPIYVNGSLVRPQVANVYGNTFDNRGNLHGKPAIGFRAVDRVSCWGNTIYGYVRAGEPIPADGSAGSVTRDGRCAMFSLHANHFVMVGTVSSAETNAVQVMGGVTGAINLNTFEPQADVYSPIAVATNNAVTVSGNIQQFTAGQRQQPIIAPTSDPASVHNAGGNTIVIVPAK